MKNKHGRIVSAKKHRTAKKDKRLVKAGYKTEKGKFGAKKTMKKGGASLDLGIAEAKVGKNSGVRVGTKKHNIQANVGVDGINANALNLASASLDKKGLKGHIGHKKELMWPEDCCEILRHGSTSWQQRGPLLPNPG